MQLFTYEGKINFAETTALIQRIISRAEKWDKSQVKGAVISLQKCGTFAEPKELEKLCHDLEKTAEYIEKKIVLIDYSLALFERIKPFAKTHHVMLLNNKEVAQLFLDAGTNTTPLNILLFEQDETLCNEIQKYLLDHGYNLHLAKTAQEFEHKRQDREIDLAITKTALNGQISAKSPKLKIAKKLIANLPLFIDTSVETLVSLTELKATKSNHGIGEMPMPLEATPYCAAMEFKGEFNGVFFLIFPKSIALKALAAMIGDDEGVYEEGDILDGVGEFCNIITGSIKRELQAKQIDVNFELPKTYTSVEESAQAFNTTQGIWIDMLLEEEPFYLFIA